MFKHILFIFLFFYSSSNLVYSQKLKSSNEKLKTSLVKTDNSTEGTNTTNNLLVKDVDGNDLLQINDEGAAGSITFPSLSSITTSTNKLYNKNGSLMWNGNALTTGSGSSGATSIDGLSDARSQVYSVFLGSGSGISADLSKYNTGIGIDALNKITSGSENVAVGYQALNKLESGADNIAFGYLSLLSLKNASSNIAIGTRALYSNSGGFTNIAIGTDALNKNTSTLNIAIGNNSMKNNTSGDENIGIGYYSLFSNTTGRWNTAIGVKSMDKNTNGKENSALGHESLYKNISGNYNSAIGVGTIYNNTSGYENTAAGYQSLYSNTTGYRNIAIGSQALYTNNEGINNIAIGYQSLYNNNSSGADKNISIGAQSLYHNTSGNENTSIGQEASLENTQGQFNVSIGAYTNGLNQTGSKNTMIGYNAGHGQNLHSKSGNVFIGYEAGKFEQGSNKLYIENSSSSSPLIGGDFSTNEINLNGTVNISNRLELPDHDASGSAGSGSIEIGNSLRIDKNEIITNTGETLHLQNDNDGNLKVDNGTLYVDGVNDYVLVGTTTFNGSPGLYVDGIAGGTSSWVQYSDRRLKKNIKTIPNALEKVKKLRGVNFEWKKTENDSKGLKMGFIAQEAKNIIPEVVLKDGEYYRMQYAPITALLVEAVKEQQKSIKKLEKENEKIRIQKAKLVSVTKELTEIKAMLNKLMKKQTKLKLSSK